METPDFTTLNKSHTIKRKEKTEKAYGTIDSFCFCSKSLKNYTNYLIKQCFRISRKLKDGIALEDWEDVLLNDINRAIEEYNNARQEKNPDREIRLTEPIDANHYFIADAFFLSWHLKTTEIYKKQPSSTSAQACIQTVCREWKIFYKNIKEYFKNPKKFTGMPKPPGYLDKEEGRFWLTFTEASFSVDKDGFIKLPKKMPNLKIKALVDDIQQVRILVTKTAIKVHLLYRVEVPKFNNKKNILGIDLGVNNLAAVAFSNKTNPWIINGKPLKAINQFFNKEKARLQEAAKVLNGRNKTNRMAKLVEKRNNKVKDYLHKASRKVIELAVKNNIGTIVIGHNKNQKQGSGMGKRNNQSFASIPFYIFIQMIEYKARLAGIRVVAVEESYTSGTSYLDKELPVKESYNKKRRKTRGLFISNTGEKINADVNAAYQIIKKFDESRFKRRVKHNEPVNIIQVT